MVFYYHSLIFEFLACRGRVKRTKKGVLHVRLCNWLFLQMIVIIVFFSMTLWLFPLHWRQWWILCSDLTTIYCFSWSWWGYVTALSVLSSPISFSPFSPVLSSRHTCVPPDSFDCFFSLICYLRTIAIYRWWNGNINNLISTFLFFIWSRLHRYGAYEDS